MFASRRSAAVSVVAARARGGAEDAEDDAAPGEAAPTATPDAVAAAPA
eukprot:CAMPEP_0195144702 /NCGR_PEP_ID=MMETSP0448-20130528/168572_1 /TAXON_ID=66468 /ORGANISM="Heterocapsa triquestra, Strain CCMP 448" /LENGTH=47 /DNA_ID= /DNA_START= /DNA_END= /DNA_ORIENTATION=